MVESEAMWQVGKTGKHKNNRLSYVHQKCKRRLSVTDVFPAYCGNGPYDHIHTFSKSMPIDLCKLAHRFINIAWVRIDNKLNFLDVKLFDYFGKVIKGR